jgi:hypothetical protein
MAKILMKPILQLVIESDSASVIAIIKVLLAILASTFLFHAERFWKGKHWSIGYQPANSDQ